MFPREHLNNGLNERKNQSREDLGKGSSGREFAVQSPMEIKLSVLRLKKTKCF